MDLLQKGWKDNGLKANYYGILRGISVVSSPMVEIEKVAIVVCLYSTNETN